MPYPPRLIALNRTSETEEEGQEARKQNKSSNKCWCAMWQKAQQRSVKGDLPGAKTVLRKDPKWEFGSGSFAICPDFKAPDPSGEVRVSKGYGETAPHVPRSRRAAGEHAKEAENCRTKRSFYVERDVAIVMGWFGIICLQPTASFFPFFFLF